MNASFLHEKFWHKNASQSFKEKNLSEKSNQSGKVWRGRHNIRRHFLIPHIEIICFWFPSLDLYERNVSNTNYFEWSPSLHWLFAWGSFRKPKKRRSKKADTNQLKVARLETVTIVSVLCGLWTSLRQLGLYALLCLLMWNEWKRNISLTNFSQLNRHLFLISISNLQKLFSLNQQQNHQINRNKLKFSLTNFLIGRDCAY